MMTEQLKNKNMLHLHNVRKVYEDSQQEIGHKVILDDIDLSVAEGEFCTVVVHLVVVNQHCFD